MRAYYKLLNYLKDTFEGIDSVSNITTDNFIDLDINKKNLYPLVNINFTTSPLITNTALTQFNVEITCVNIRDWNNEDKFDRFWYNDNRHDNWNLTHAIIRQGVNKMLKADNDFTIQSLTDLERITWDFGNGLDGWNLTATFEVVDNIAGC